MSHRDARSLLKPAASLCSVGCSPFGVLANPPYRTAESCSNSVQVESQSWPFVDCPQLGTAPFELGQPTMRDASAAQEARKGGLMSIHHTYIHTHMCTCCGGVVAVGAEAALAHSALSDLGPPLAHSALACRFNGSVQSPMKRNHLCCCRWDVSGGEAQQHSKNSFAAQRPVRSLLVHGFNE